MLLFLSLFLTIHEKIFAEVTPEQEQLMVQEQQDVRKMRYRLKALLERQELEDSLNEGENSYQDFQDLEHWMSRLQEDMTPENKKQFLKMLSQFEESVSKTLEQQQRLESLASSQSSSEQKVQKIPFSELMKVLKELVQGNRLEDAQRLLDQVLSAFNLQQQQLQQSLNKYYREQLNPLTQALKKVSAALEDSLKQERTVEKELQPFSHFRKLSEQTSQALETRQQNISKSIGQMQELLKDEFLPAMFSMKRPLSLLEKAQSFSKETQTLLKQQETASSLRSAQKTRKPLQQLQGHINNLQQQMQQMQNPRSQRKRSGRRRQGDKGLRPLKLEYNFQADPTYREDIQKLNRKSKQDITPGQQQYLQELIR